MYESKPCEIGIKPLTSSATFIIGTVMMTIGIAGNVIIYPNTLTFLSAAFAALHIIPLWLMVIESFSPNKYDKTLRALSMFKVSGVLSLIFVALYLASAFLGSLFGGIRSVFLLLILFGMLAGIAYVVIKLYFLALFKVLKSIRERIYTQKYSSIDGKNSFLVTSAIMIAFVLGISLYILLNERIEIPALPVMFIIVNTIGMILCLLVLRKFE